MTRAHGLLTALLLVAIAGIGLQAPLSRRPRHPPAKTSAAKAKATAKEKAKAPNSKAKEEESRLHQDQGEEGRSAKQGSQEDKKEAKKRARKKRKPPRARASGKGAKDAASSEAETPAVTGELATVKQAIEHARAGRASQATGLQQSIQDPVSRKLVEWAILRSDSNGASSARYLAFINANPNWPSVGMMRRRAEAMMWVEQPDHSTARAYFAKNPPLTARGQFTLARALLATGDRAGAQAQVREAWRNESLGRRS